MPGTLSHQDEHSKLCPWGRQLQTCRPKQCLEAKGEAEGSGRCPRGPRTVPAGHPQGPGGRVKRWTKPLCWHRGRRDQKGLCSPPSTSVDSPSTSKTEDANASCWFSQGKMFEQKEIYDQERGSTCATLCPVSPSPEGTGFELLFCALFTGLPSVSFFFIYKTELGSSHCPESQKIK